MRITKKVTATKYSPLRFCAGKYSHKNKAPVFGACFRRYVTPMKLHASIFTLICLTSLNACAVTDIAPTVNSSINYTRGTEALENGDYERAAELLRESVRLDPTLSRNHNNLATALFELGHLKEGWLHVRQAVLLDPKNEFSAANSKRYIVALLNQEGLNTGVSLSDVVAVLGEPDGKSQQNNCLWYQYGSSALCFEDNVFAIIGDMQYK